MSVKMTSYSFDPFTNVYRPDDIKRIAGISSDNISFRDIIQPQANWENYDTEIFRTSRNWRQHEMHN